jgi:hypothetical protein
MSILLVHSVAEVALAAAMCIVKVTDVTARIALKVVLASRRIDDIQAIVVKFSKRHDTSLQRGLLSVITIFETRLPTLFTTRSRASSLLRSVTTGARSDVYMRVVRSNLHRSRLSTSHVHCEHRRCNFSTVITYDTYE